MCVVVVTRALMVGFRSCPLILHAFWGRRSGARKDLEVDGMDCGITRVPVGTPGRAAPTLKSSSTRWSRHRRNRRDCTPRVVLAPDWLVTCFLPDYLSCAHIGLPDRLWCCFAESPDARADGVFAFLRLCRPAIATTCADCRAIQREGNASVSPSAVPPLSAAKPTLADSTHPR